MIDRVRDRSDFICYFCGFVCRLLCIPYSHSCFLFFFVFFSLLLQGLEILGLLISSCFSCHGRPQWLGSFIPPCTHVVSQLSGPQRTTRESRGFPHVLAGVTPQSLSYLSLNVTSSPGAAPVMMSSAKDISE